MTTPAVPEWVAQFEAMDALEKAVALAWRDVWTAVERAQTLDVGMVQLAQTAERCVFADEP